MVTAARSTDKGRSRIARWILLGVLLRRMIGVSGVSGGGGLGGVAVLVGAAVGVRVGVSVGAAVGLGGVVGAPWVAKSQTGPAVFQPTLLHPPPRVSPYSATALRALSGVARPLRVSPYSGETTTGPDERRRRESASRARMPPRSC